METTGYLHPLRRPAPFAARRRSHPEPCGIEARTLRRVARPPSPATPIGLAPGAPSDAAGQDARKYQSTNIVVRRLLDRWLHRLAGLVPDDPGLVLDIGVGEGFALERIVD